LNGFGFEKDFARIAMDFITRSKFLSGEILTNDVTNFDDKLIADCWIISLVIFLKFMVPPNKNLMIRTLCNK
jgi:hypothetical protein